MEESWLSTEYRMEKCDPMNISLHEKDTRFSFVLVVVESKLNIVQKEHTSAPKIHSDDWKEETLFW